MTTKDKAREKLLNSMRKTKAVINDQPDSKQAHAETYAPAASKTAKPKKATAKSTHIADQVAALPTTAPTLVSDPYQSHGRIWPD